MTANQSKTYPGHPLNMMSEKPNLNCSMLNQNKQTLLHSKLEQQWAMHCLLSQETVWAKL